MITDAGQQDRSKRGKEFEHVVWREITPMLEGSPFAVVGIKTRPLEIKQSLRVPSLSVPDTEMSDPDCDVVIYNTKTMQLCLAIHVRVNVREAEKNSHWVERMKRHAPTSHIGHIVVTKDKDKQLVAAGVLRKYKKKQLKKQRDTLGLYDATYVMREGEVYESPRLLNIENKKFDTLIIRRFDKFKLDIINQIIEFGGVDFPKLRNHIQESYGTDTSSDESKWFS